MKRLVLVVCALVVAHTSFVLCRMLPKIQKDKKESEYQIPARQEWAIQ